ncbi:MAG: hypothetical protein EOO15_00885 [Chitinophagaceae bacterium]|nr:MAG: hypothetical protein EOO15_00885 [Chitinophagaceae bacterium]
MKQLLVLLLIVLNQEAFAQSDSIRHRIFLVGDAGELTAGKHPVVDWLQAHVDWNDPRNTVLFLGDNIYPLGLPHKGEPQYEESRKILDYQVNLVRDKRGKAFVVPGNHDWMNGKGGGWSRVQNQVDYINGLERANTRALPVNGCPGPVEVELDEKVVLVFIDSQWFLHINEKPGSESSCEATTVDEFIAQLQEIADRHPAQLLVVVMHHPLYTHGEHGGSYTLRSHLFPLAEAVPNLYIPLPILGSVYPLARGVFGSLQDVNHPLYRNMTRRIEAVLKSHPNAVHVAGHDHSLQLLVKDSVPYIVSGSGSKLTRVNRGRYTRFSDLSLGFAYIEVWKSGKAEVKFTNLQASDLARATFSYPLTPNRSIATETAAKTSERPYPRDTTVAANEFIHTRGRKVLLHGKNYRKEWTTPVSVPVLDIGIEEGGLKPVRRSGNLQNRTLILEDTSGKQWRLRSLVELPQSILPPDLQSPFATDSVGDALSASYPFGALSLGVLERAAGIPTVHRKLVYIPDDPRLDRFRQDFSETMAVLEEVEPAGVDSAVLTEDVVRRLQQGAGTRIDESVLLRSRLLDNFVMNFERQEQQWRWLVQTDSFRSTYVPFATDQSQAFYVNEGFFPRLIRKPRYIPEIQGFRPKAFNIKTFNRSARNFDYYFLNRLSEDQWKEAIATFLHRMTDSVLEASLRQQPEPVRGYQASRILQTLKERKGIFERDMLTYYRFLARKVDVRGTDGRERFEVMRAADGTLHVKVVALDSSGQLLEQLYERRFEPGVTREVRLYGLSDNDEFEVQGGPGKIKIRMIGGPGNDTFRNVGTGTAVVHDVAYEQNQILGTGFRSRMTNSAQEHLYNRFSLKYDHSKLGLSIGFNSEDLVFLGLKFESIKQGFRKAPFGSRNLIAFNHSLINRSYQFRYEGTFVDAYRGHDLLVLANFRSLGNTNFFGYGNNIVYSGGRQDIDRYRAKFDIGDVHVLLRLKIQAWMHLDYGLSFQTLRMPHEENAGKHISETLNGRADPAFYAQKTWTGALFRFQINSKNSPTLPTRGFVFDAQLRPLWGWDRQAHAITRLQVETSAFLSLFNFPRVVLATRLGYGVTYGNFEYPQAQFLGGNENLRGYRRQRFTGKSAAFNNIELRYRVREIKFFLLPGAAGILAFHDIGRVQIDGAHSDTWHTGYGGGFWVAPINRLVVSATLSFSKEERFLPLVKAGFLF